MSAVRRVQVWTTRRDFTWAAHLAAYDQDGRPTIEPLAKQVAHAADYEPVMAIFEAQTGHRVNRETARQNQPGCSWSSWSFEVIL